MIVKLTWRFYYCQATEAGIILTTWHLNEKLIAEKKFGTEQVNPSFQNWTDYMEIQLRHAV